MFKRIYFATYSKTVCLDPYRYFISPTDINYLETYCLPADHFPLSFCQTCAWAYCDTTYETTLQKLETSNFIFFPSDSVHLNYMTWFDNDTYKVDYVVRDIANIVMNHDTMLISKLLYSPNYVLALYAMEAFIFLESENKIQLNSVMTQKMEELLNSSIGIKYQYSDVVRHAVKYKNLGIRKQDIIKKYSRIK